MRQLQTNAAVKKMKGWVSHLVWGEPPPFPKWGAHPLLGSCTMVPGALGELTVHAVLYITGQWLVARCPKPRKAQTSRSHFQSDCPHQGGDPGLRSVQILMSQCEPVSPMTALCDSLIMGHLEKHEQANFSQVFWGKFSTRRRGML